MAQRLNLTIPDDVMAELKQLEDDLGMSVNYSGIATEALKQEIVRLRALSPNPRRMRVRNLSGGDFWLIPQPARGGSPQSIAPEPRYPYLAGDGVTMMNSDCLPPATPGVLLVVQPNLAKLLQSQGRADVVAAW